MAEAEAAAAPPTAMEEDSGAGEAAAAVEAEPEEQDEEWKLQAESFKSAGNDAFKLGQWQEAVEMYTRAIQLDDQDKVYYSNRSAAYLKLGDAKSKALKDAEKCVELGPDWPKGYSRLGAAQHALRRFDAAIDTYKKGWLLDPTGTAWEGSIKAAEEGAEVDRKARWAAADLEREAERVKEEARLELQREFKAKEEKEKAKAAKMAAKLGTAPPPADDDPLSSFLAEVVGEKKVEKVAHEKYTTQNLGTPAAQIARLLQDNYKWKNLNPYDVMQLGTDATVEDIKTRYRKLAPLVHPDKQLDQPQATDAFEEVKKAYQMLMDEDKRATVSSTIDNIRAKIVKERNRLIAKGLTEAQLVQQSGTEEAHIQKECWKEFAKVELRRREIDKHHQAQRKRERAQEDEAKEILKKTCEAEKSWAEEDRRENRVGSWRGFEAKGGAKKPKTKMWKAEEQEKKHKFGEVDNSSYKKDWK